MLAWRACVKKSGNNCTHAQYYFRKACMFCLQKVQ